MNPLRFCSFTCVSILVFSAYFLFTVYQFYTIMFPVFLLADDEPYLGPLWKEGQLLDGVCYVSSKPKWADSDFTNSRVVFVGEFRELSFDWKDNERTIEFNVSLLPSIEDNSTKALTNPLWKLIRNNGSVYLHVHLTQNGMSPDPRQHNYDKLRTLHHATPLIKYAERRNLKNATRLLASYIPSTSKDEEITEPIHLPGEPTGEDPALTAPIVSYWKPHMAIRLVTSFKRYPLSEVPPLVFHNIRMENVDGHWKYLPVMFVDEMGLTSEKLMPLNRSITTLPLKLSYEPMSYARWQMMLTFGSALRQQKDLGFGEDDLDQMRSLIADTNPYLLAVTMTVSLLHMLFDWLAFKSDISFWQENQSLVGISVRSMVITFFSQIIIFFYLLEQETTLLILVPSGISIVIQLWKIYRATAPKVSFSSQTLLSLKFTRSAPESSETDAIDLMAMRYMSYALSPLLVGYAIYSLLYKDHTGWYSYVLGSLTGTVYTFGFIMMTPQLFINYKLKSVAHLPWRFLIYRALNTFIDDLFAFIITMPTMHRISCFRDDIVFFIYLYQRWIYPVDTSRRHEDMDGAATETHQKQE
ncbi:cleft lip and palate transmembrane family protein [Thraustotheca clavata]|uniref:Cleft lip and palate transmembrane family protein n=1 Tax=Thraustotheca clavata TaxID=74557 RepID=A0A1W0A8R7_9STRA|nr:cleft lip and palate transmembrane family protein [Thraustotheca clavata]